MEDPEEITEDLKARMRAMAERKRRELAELEANEASEMVQQNATSASVADANLDAEVDESPLVPNDAFLTKLQAQLIEMQERHRQHASQCRARWCNECGRHPCATCRRVQVDEWDGVCASCRLRTVVEQIGIPRRYRDARFDSEALSQRVRSVSVVRASREASAARNVIAIGPSGSGKSSVMSAMVQNREKLELERKSFRGPLLWVSALDLERARAEHRLGDGEAMLVTRAINAGLLVIDDLGAESPRAADVIAHVIHTRHDDEAATWVTTGLSAADIASRYSGGVERRLYEGAAIVQCGGAQ